MPNYSKVILVGHLVRDCETRSLSTGTMVMENAIAVNRKYKEDEKVSFIDFKVFNKTAEIMAKYLNKGDAAMIEGELIQDRWENAEGEKRSKIYVLVDRFVFMPKSSKPENGDEKPETEHAPF